MSREHWKMVESQIAKLKPGMIAFLEKNPQGVSLVELYGHSEEFGESITRSTFLDLVSTNTVNVTNDPNTGKYMVNLTPQE